MSGVKGRSGVYKHKLHTEEWKKAASRRWLGILNPAKRADVRQKLSLSATGRKHTEETKEKIRQIKLKNPPRFFLGKKMSLEHRKKLSESHIGLHCGEKSGSWRGGITPLNKKLRNSREYLMWRNEVFKKDNYTCQHCNKRGIAIQADHIKPFALYPDLRFTAENGRTLCIPCHRETPTFAGRTRISKNVYDSIES